MKRLILSLAVAASACAAFADEPATPAVPADSVARALAVFWTSSYNLDRVPAGQMDNFISGLADFLRTTPEADKEAYVQGAYLGMSLVSSMGQLAQLGIVTTPEEVAPIYLSILRGEPVGMTPTEAERMLDRAAGIEPDTVFTPEAQMAFLANEAARDGAVTTPSGLIFQVITEGEGPMPVSGDSVSLTYVGKLSDGSVFDATEEPVTFDVDRLVPGFSEGLKMMRPGGTYRLVIPPDLGYGDTGAGGGVIPPGAALDFTVNLLGINKQ